jgi:hypothetical protein
MFNDGWPNGGGISRTFMGHTSRPPAVPHLIARVGAIEIANNQEEDAALLIQWLGLL